MRIHFGKSGRPIVSEPSMGHAVRPQGIEFGQTQLHRMKTKEVGHGAIDESLLPIEQIPTGRGLQPRPQTYTD